MRRQSTLPLLREGKGGSPSAVAIAPKHRDFHGFVSFTPGSSKRLQRPFRIRFHDIPCALTWRFLGAALRVPRLRRVWGPFLSTPAADGGTESVSRPATTRCPRRLGTPSRDYH